MKTAQRKRSHGLALGLDKAELRLRLAEAEETLRAIHSGEVDAVVVAGEEGRQIFTLQGADQAYRVLIESMNEGALTLTADMTILYANRCFAGMVQCPLEQVIGSSFRRFLSGGDEAALQLLLERADKSGNKIPAQLVVGDGSEIPAQISVRPLAKQSFNQATVSVVVTDMTEARRAASLRETARLYTQVCEHAAQLESRVAERTSQLLAANQELEAFESSVSHDLRGPLRSLTRFAHLLIDDLALQLPEEARDYLNRILSSAEKMNRLILALLEFSSQSKRSLAFQSVDVGGMCREILAEMAPELVGRIVEVTISDLPQCHADPVLLRQVLVNLLGNALKYSRTRDRSVIAISSVAQVNGGSSAYSIKDNGVGFDMKDAAKLFTIFTRLHHASDFEGTGVGLTTAQRIIQRHGGRIWAESAPDAGATFFFTLGRPPPNSNYKVGE